MRSMTAAWLICGMACGPALATDPATHQWAVYANAKYQFQTCYPADLLHGQGESPASDGQVFSGPDGAKLTASAIYNIDNDSLAQLSDETARRLAGDHGQVTYRHTDRRGFTLSGTSGDTVFYSKTVVAHDTIKHFELVYPAARADTYNSVAAHLQGCFLDLQK